jgi:uncharacterized membrane protein HdeD (DUF308 family)
MTFDGGLPLPPGRRDIGQAIEHLHGRWPWFAAFGATAVLLGMVSLGMLGVATLASVYLVAVFVILIGGLDLSLALHAHRWSSRLFVGSVGLLYIVAGAFALARPEAGALGLTLMIGVALLATGVMRIALAINLPVGPRWHVGVAGLVTTLLGGMIVAGWPENSAYMLGIFLGVDMLFYGASWIGFALFLRRRLAPPR